MSFICDFCNSNFSAKCSLNLHLKKAKYCLEKRGKNHKDEYKCKICKKTFSEKRYLEKHSEKCDVESIIEKNKTQKDQIILLKTRLEDYEKIIQEQKDQIHHLQNKLENIAIQGVKKATNTTNNILQLEPIHKDWLESQATLLTEDHFSRGIAGLAQFAIENSFKNRVICTDQSRKSLKFKDSNGDICKDPKGKKLATLFFDSIHSKAENIIPDMIEKIKSELDDAGDEIVLENIRLKMNELISVEKGIKRVSKDHEIELREQFTTQLCELLPNP